MITMIKKTNPSSFLIQVIPDNPENPGSEFFLFAGTRHGTFLFCHSVTFSLSRLTYPLKYFLV